MKRLFLNGLIAITPSLSWASEACSLGDLVFGPGIAITISDQILHCRTGGEDDPDPGAYLWRDSSGTPKAIIPICIRESLVYSEGVYVIENGLLLSCSKDGKWTSQTSN